MHCVNIGGFVFSLWLGHNGSSLSEKLAWQSTRPTNNDSHVTQSQLGCACKMTIERQPVIHILTTVVFCWWLVTVGLVNIHSMVLARLWKIQSSYNGIMYYHPFTPQQKLNFFSVFFFFFTVPTKVIELWYHKFPLDTLSFGKQFNWNLTEVQLHIEFQILNKSFV